MLPWNKKPGSSRQNVAFNQFKDGRNKGWPLKSWGNPLQVDPTKLEKRGLLSCWKWSCSFITSFFIYVWDVCVWEVWDVGMLGLGENSGNPKLLDPWDPWLSEKEDPKKQRQFRIQDGILIQIPTQPSLSIYIYIIYIYICTRILQWCWGNASISVGGNWKLPRIWNKDDWNPCRRAHANDASPVVRSHLLKYYR